MLTNKKLLTLLCALALFIPFNKLTAQYKIELSDSNSFQKGEGVIVGKTSFRGLSVVDDHTIWASGSRGTYARSTDAGAHFHFKQIKGYEKSDFRDVEAFDQNRAILMSSGTPALILKTTDGGQTWMEVFRRNDSAYFLDAMDFWDEQKGVIVGDPISNHFVILTTTDGGETWIESDTSKAPLAMDGEAVFAASGTSLRCWEKERFGFVTGGSTSRFIYIEKSGGKYDHVLSGLSQNKESAGAFSFAAYNNGKFLITGGDYTKDTISDHTVSSLSLKGNASNVYPANGYRSCIELIPEKALFILCGTSGVDIGQHKWLTLSNESFNVVRKAKKGKAVFLAGNKGKIGRLVF